MEEREITFEPDLSQVEPEVGLSKKRPSRANEEFDERKRRLDREKIRSSLALRLSKVSSKQECQEMVMSCMTIILEIQGQLEYMRMKYPEMYNQTGIHPLIEGMTVGWMVRLSELLKIDRQEMMDLLKPLYR